MYYKCGYWEFPKIDDIKIIDKDFIFMGPCTPSEITKKGYQFKNDEKAHEIYKAFKNKA